MGCLRQINCNNANLDLDVLLSFISYDNNNTTPKIIFHGYVKPCLDSLMVTKSLKSRGVDLSQCFAQTTIHLGGMGQANECRSVVSLSSAPLQLHLNWPPPNMKTLRVRAPESLYIGAVMLKPTSDASISISSFLFISATVPFFFVAVFNWKR